MCVCVRALLSSVEGLEGHVCTLVTQALPTLACCATEPPLSWRAARKVLGGHPSAKCSWRSPACQGQAEQCKWALVVSGYLHPLLCSLDLAPSVDHFCHPVLTDEGTECKEPSTLESRVASSKGHVLSLGTENYFPCHFLGSSAEPEVDSGPVLQQP